jgi:hypothetical protein
MAENSRVRIPATLEQYLKSQAPRVLGISENAVSSVHLSELMDKICYEHRQIFAGVLMPANGMQMLAVAVPTEQGTESINSNI